MKVVFDTIEPLRFAQVEEIHWRTYQSPDEPVRMQVAYFDSFEDIHHTFDAYGIENEIWWENGNEVFDDADAFITIP